MRCRVGIGEQNGAEAGNGETRDQARRMAKFSVMRITFDERKTVSNGVLSGGKCEVCRREISRLRRAGKR